MDPNIIAQHGPWVAILVSLSSSVAPAMWWLVRRIVRRLDAVFNSHLAFIKATAETQRKLSETVSSLEQSMGELVKTQEALVKTQAEQGKDIRDIRSHLGMDGNK